MTSNYVLWLCVLASWSIISLCIECVITDELDDIIFPSTIYENSQLNWFGCWFLFILLSIFSPVGFALKVIGIMCWAISSFVKFIFTVGRDD